MRHFEKPGKDKMLDRKDCLLSPLAEKDLDVVLRWRNSDRVRTNMFTDRIISLAEHRAWFEGVKKNAFPTQFLFVHKDMPLGVFNISRIDTVNHHCLWGFYIGEEKSPRGAGTAMCFLALEHIFDILKFRKVYAEVLSHNVKSIALHEKLLFSLEGTLKEHAMKNGAPVDALIYALFERDWHEVRSRLQSLCFKDPS